MAHPVYRVFISSTFLDLAPERRLVLQAIQDLNASLATLGIALIPIDLQRGAAPGPPLNVCLAEVGRSDIILTIVARCYGSTSTTGLSMTEMEFDEATKRGLHRFVYYKNDAVIVLPEHIDTEPDMIQKLLQFRKKIDSQLKRDIFMNPDELRGHVIRDLMKWILTRPDVAKSIPASVAGVVFTGSSTILEALASGRWNDAANALYSRQFRLDMKRFGLEDLYLALLRDLLELGSLAPPTRILEASQRSKMLLTYVEAGGNTLSTQVALEQAASLEGTINHPHYSFELARHRAQMIIADSGRYELAIPVLKRLLRCGKQTNDPHLIAQSKASVAHYYSCKGDHRRALKWCWKTIRNLIRVRDTCVFCLCNAFLAAGNEHIACGDCDLINDRFGKALMIALMIPNRSRQVQALHGLAQHLCWHDDLRHGIAAYVWLSRLSREMDPSSEDADLGNILGELVVKHGSDTVQNHLKDVQGQAEKLVMEALAPYHLENFTTKLELKPSKAGDHW